MADATTAAPQTQKTRGVLELARPVKPTLPFLQRAMTQTESYCLNPRLWSDEINWVVQSRAKDWFGQRWARAKARRFERRRAVVLTMKALQYRMDALTLRCGSPTADGDFVGISVESLIHSTGCSRSQIERALRDLEKQGFIESTQRRQKLTAGGWLAFASVRRITLKWFNKLGMVVSVRLLRRRAYKAKKERERIARETYQKNQLSAGARGMREAAASSILARVEALTTRPNPSSIIGETPLGDTYVNRKKDDEVARMLVSVAADNQARIRHGQPAWTGDEILAEARRRTERPDK